MLLRVFCLVLSYLPAERTFGLAGHNIIKKTKATISLIPTDVLSNKENNVFKDALGVKGLGFKHHGNW